MLLPVGADFEIVQSHLHDQLLFIVELLERFPNDSLNGMLRTTYYSTEHGRMVRDKGLADLADAPDDLYRTNIQIGELNALNACLAVIRFKQLRGFYFEELPLYHLLFEIGDLKIVSESQFDED